jgi:hypothetical protein
MKRVQKKIKYAGKVWTVSSLVPADFLSCSHWPFSYYRLEENSRQKSLEVKRDWKLKPKNISSDEEKLAESVKQAVKIGININFDGEYEKIKSDESVHAVLLSQIYALTYNLSLAEKYFLPFQIISKDFAEALAVKAKTLCVEPYSFLVNLSKEPPELYNPKRYDFNWFILGVGWEKERREMEKAQAEMKSKMQLRKR